MSDEDDDRPRYPDKSRPDREGYPTVDWRGDALVIIRCSSVECRRRLRMGKHGEGFKPKLPEAMYTKEAPRILCPYCFYLAQTFGTALPIAKPSIKPAKTASTRKRPAKLDLSVLLND